MTTIRSFTSLEQSRKLAEILPIESADMWWVALNWQETEYYVEVKQDGINQPKKAIPCWSLAALSEFILPYIADNDGNNYKFYLSKDGLDRWVAYYKSDNVSIHICEESDNMIDVILEMVCWLKNEEYI
jgi:hypothetical protein